MKLFHTSFGGAVFITILTFAGAIITGVPEMFLVAFINLAILIYKIIKVYNKVQKEQRFYVDNDIKTTLEELRLKKCYITAIDNVMATYGNRISLMSEEEVVLYL